MAVTQRPSPKARGGARVETPQPMNKKLFSRPAASRQPTRNSPSRTRHGVAARQVARTAFDGHETDMWGVGLIVAAVIIGLGVYADLTGPVGRGINWLVASLVGVLRFAVPVVMAWIGIALLAGKERANPARVGVSLGLAMVGLSGFLDVFRGPTHFVFLSNLVRKAGGIVGQVIAQPMRALVAGWGAGLVCATMIFVAVLVLTRTSVRDAAGVTATGMAFMGRGAAASGSAIGRWFRSITTLRNDATRAINYDDFDDYDDDPTMDDVMPATQVFDVDAEPADQRPSSEPKPLAAAKIMKPTVPKYSAPSAVAQDELNLGPGAQRGEWHLPGLDMLKRTGSQEIDRAQIEQGGRDLVSALLSHGVEATLVGMTVGPTVTRYELELAEGVRVARVTALNKDIAYAMAAADVRILAPIPGQRAIGVEVPNRERQLVTLGDILVSPEARKADHPLEVAVGRDIAGRAVFINLATTPHLLVAGATGKGKSSFLNSMLASILARATPEQVKLILIDPKRVEMGQYNKLPHLLTPVVTDAKKAANALSWAVHEMERRYDLLQECGFRDITGYNAAFDRGELNDEVDPLRAEVDPASVKHYTRLPFVLVVIDELADLMMVAAHDVEESICRIAQMARAVGIHLVIATQRPSVNVITGLIKANIPARMAFAVSSLTDSRVILDQPGAERLIGHGDMLLLGPTSSVAMRIQGAWIGEDETRKITGFWKRQAPNVEFVNGIEGESRDGAGLFGSAGNSGSNGDDDLLIDAMRLVVDSNLGSTSMLQRKLKVGFARAGRIMDLLEERGVVGPSVGSKPREVLMSAEEFENLRESGGI